MKSLLVRAPGVPVPRYRAQRGDAPIGNTPVEVPNLPYYRAQIRRGDLVDVSDDAPRTEHES